MTMMMIGQRREVTQLLLPSLDSTNNGTHGKVMTFNVDLHHHASSFTVMFYALFAALSCWLSLAATTNNNN